MSYEIEPNRYDVIEMPDGTKKHFTGAERDTLDQLSAALVEEIHRISVGSVKWKDITDGHRHKVRTAAIRLLDEFRRTGSSIKTSAPKASSTKED